MQGEARYNPLYALRQALALLPFCAALLWIDSAWGWLFWWW